MRHAVGRVAILLVCVGVGASVIQKRLAAPTVETASYSHRVVSAPALCPWRNPDSDLRVLFPGANGWRQETLVLSPLRLRILKRLGPDAKLEDNSLRVYRVTRSGQPVGSILVRRAPGEFGAVELVVGVNLSGQVTGVRVQRHREPPEVAAVALSPLWLGAMRGLTAFSHWEVGHGLPVVPASAVQTANAVARTVRAQLIEFEEGQTRR